MQILMNVLYVAAIQAAICLPIWAVSNGLLWAYRKFPRFAAFLRALNRALEAIITGLGYVTLGVVALGAIHVANQSRASYRKDLYKDPKRY